MPSFFTSVAGRHACTLFEIRLESDFIVFRGNEHEASGQLLKGVVVLCLREHLRVEDIHLRLTGTCRLAWFDARQTPTGIHSQKVDRTTTILKHTWAPFIGGPATHGHGQTLAPGNYEWPFEFMLNGDTAESVEGLYQTNVSYFLKATINRGKLAKNHHAYKRLRIVRTLDPSALEFNHAMSVENIWPNKIEYSVVIPQKAIVFGSTIPLQMRFTPLLKGLEMGEITVKLMEIQEYSIQGYGTVHKSHKHERDVTKWTFEVDKDEVWHDNIDETGQEGWVVNKELPLPRKLSQCVQDCSVHGIKIRHKIKLTVALKNPDGHISELRATLPVTIFISPNIPLDDEGNLMSPANASETTSERTASATESEPSNMAPPGYGLHILDQLYEDIDPSGIMTPGAQSGFNTPFYALSRAGSHENLAQMASAGEVTPAALSSRLQSVSLDQSHRNRSFNSTTGTGFSTGFSSGTQTPHHPHFDGDHTAESSQPASTELSRQTSAEHNPHSGHDTPPEHVDDLDLEELSKVPSYSTATRAPLPRTSSYPGLALPDYQTAMTAPNSPTRSPISDPLATISEGAPADLADVHHDGQERRSRNSSMARRSLSSTLSYLHLHTSDLHGDRRVRLLP